MLCGKGGEGVFGFILSIYLSIGLIGTTKASEHLKDSQVFIFCLDFFTMLVLAI